jgi:UDP-2-acetamido-2,6-beta-L-arabino-hexul-4-ose reductase
MKILVTGAKGFIGKNLCLILREEGNEVFEFDVGSTDDDLRNYSHSADFVIHLAGVNRPLFPEEFLAGNVIFTKKLLDFLDRYGHKAPIIFSSSIQAALDSPYGKSKKIAEDQLFEYEKKTGTPVYVYRLYNVFGKWCRPNYNSVIATWCYDAANNLPLQINQLVPAIDFVYIDDVIVEFLRVIENQPKPTGEIMYAEPHYSEKLEDIAAALDTFKKSRENEMLPKLGEGFYKKLYSTYLSYLPEDKLAYELLMHKDIRGSFTEAFKSPTYGQISVNVSKPGVTKGNHYHMSKNEKYLVVTGTCLIKLRKATDDNIVSYTCDGKDLKVVDIPPGYTHNITNIGKEDSVTVMWANELYDPDHPDTYFLPVEKEDVTALKGTKK